MQIRKWEGFGLHKTSRRECFFVSTSSRETVGGEACLAPLRSTYKHNNDPRDSEGNATSHIGTLLKCMCVCEIFDKYILYFSILFY